MGAQAPTTDEESQPPELVTMTTIRAFIAVQLPEDVRDALGETARALAVGVPRGAVRWVRPEQMHLTLAFLGDTPTAKLPAVQQAMDAVAGGLLPFTLHAGDIGCFPNRRRPRVIWVGLSGEEERLATLKRALDEALAPLGWPPEAKPFRAHLTLGRAKDEQAARSIDWTAGVPRLPVPVATLHLIESRLTPSGPIYTERVVSRIGQ